MKKILLHPITRSNNFCAVEVTIENKRVVDARSSTHFFRGFESILQGRDPRDASYLTQRICGICSSAHGTAATLALENAAGVTPPRNGNLLRNLLFGADLLQNHIRHFYFFTLVDFARGPELAPFTPGYKQDYRLPALKNEQMIKHYFQAVEISRLCHELVTLLGGKAPYSHGILAGGSTVPPEADILMNFSFKLKRINDFMKEVMLPDVYEIAEFYRDYYQIGSRPPEFLEFGLFPLDESDTERAFPAGTVIGGEVQKINSAQIQEHLKYAWFTSGNEPRHPFLEHTDPDREKEEAYSWVKAPRYAGKAMEGGPLARLWIRGDYRKGVSVLDRTVTRALEAQMTGELMEKWLKELEPGGPVFNPFEVPREAAGVGLTGAMRGPLGHWLKIDGGRIAHYQIITPSAWNFSPRDDRGLMGPVENALLGTPVENEDEPIEVVRVVHSFDVCASCSSHVIVPGKPVKDFVILP